MDNAVALCYRPSMSQPAKLSDSLVLDARLAGETVQRSIAGQVEFWARLGRAIEPLLDGDRVLALCRSGEAHPLSACLEPVDTPEGRKRVADYLRNKPYPQLRAGSRHPRTSGAN